MNQTVSFPLKAISVLLLGVLGASPLLAVAQTCDPDLARAAAQGQQKKLEEEARRSEDVYGGHSEQPDWLQNSDGLLTACMSNNWPQIKVSQPMLQAILSGAQEKAAKAACNKARQSVLQSSRKYTNMLRTIPGYNNLQGYNSNLGQWGEVGQLQGDTLPGIATSSVSWNDIVGSTSNAPRATTGTTGNVRSTGAIPGITP